MDVRAAVGCPERDCPEVNGIPGCMLTDGGPVICRWPEAWTPCPELGGGGLNAGGGPGIPCPETGAEGGPCSEMGGGGP